MLLYCFKLVIYLMTFAFCCMLCEWSFWKIQIYKWASRSIFIILHKPWRHNICRCYKNTKKPLKNQKGKLKLCDFVSYMSNIIWKCPDLWHIWDWNYKVAFTVQLLFTIVITTTMGHIISPDEVLVNVCTTGEMRQWVCDWTVSESSTKQDADWAMQVRSNLYQFHLALSLAQS